MRQEGDVTGWPISERVSQHLGLPRWLGGEESTCQCRKRRFDPWVGTTLWRREWLLIPVFLPGEFNGQRHLGGYIQSIGLQKAGHVWATEHAHTQHPFLLLVFSALSIIMQIS